MQVWKIHRIIVITTSITTTIEKSSIYAFPLETSFMYLHFHLELLLTVFETIF